MSHIEYSIDNRNWKYSHHVIRTIRRTKDKVDLNAALQIRYGADGSENSELRRMAVLAELFLQVAKRKVLPKRRRPERPGDHVAWARELLDDLMPAGNFRTWELQEQGKIAPFGAFALYMAAIGVRLDGRPLVEGVDYFKKGGIVRTTLAPYAGQDTSRHRFIIVSKIDVKQVGALGAAAIKKAKEEWDEYAPVRDQHTVRFFDGTAAEAHDLALGPEEILVARGQTLAQTLETHVPAWNKPVSMPCTTFEEEVQFEVCGVVVTARGKVALSGQMYWEVLELVDAYVNGGFRRHCDFDLLCNSVKAWRMAKEKGEPVIMAKWGHRKNFPDIRLTYQSGLAKTFVAQTRGRETYHTASGEATACELLLGDASEAYKHFPCTLSDCPYFSVVATDNALVFRTRRLGLDGCGNMAGRLCVLHAADPPEDAVNPMQVLARYAESRVPEREVTCT